MTSDRQAPREVSRAGEASLRWRLSRASEHTRTLRRPGSERAYAPGMTTGTTDMERWDEMASRYRLPAVSRQLRPSPNGLPR